MTQTDTTKQSPPQWTVDAATALARQRKALVLAGQAPMTTEQEAVEISRHAPQPSGSIQERAERAATKVVGMLEDLEHMMGCACASHSVRTLLQLSLGGKLAEAAELRRNTRLHPLECFSDPDEWVVIPLQDFEKCTELARRYLQLAGKEE